jgi:hypothetical protein
MGDLRPQLAGDEAGRNRGCSGQRNYLTSWLCASIPLQAGFCGKRNMPLSRYFCVTRAVPGRQRKLGLSPQVFLEPRAAGLGFWTGPAATKRFDKFR